MILSLVVATFLVAGLLSLLPGCGTLTLRPVQHDHALRMAEVRTKLETDDARLAVMLAYTQAQCDSLDSTVTGVTAGSLGVGALAGASGLSSIFTTNTPRLAITITGVVLAVATPVMGYVSTNLAQRFTRKCTVNTGGAP